MSVDFCAFCALSVVLIGPIGLGPIRLKQIP